MYFEVISQFQISISVTILRKVYIDIHIMNVRCKTLAEVSSYKIILYIATARINIIMYS